ncbi:MAG: GDSL-type esterase/lipase family protein [Clostridiales bacterium]|jgi:hypothetical protein|nr:GDSL-type esterase/lipase family protein [Clostridiales bacterium]
MSLLIFILINAFFACGGNKNENGGENLEPIITTRKTYRQLADEKLIKMHGRHYESGSGSAVWFNQTASGFEINFRGISLSAEFTADWKTTELSIQPQLQIFVDDENDAPSATRLELAVKGKRTYTIVDGLTYGDHNIKIFKKSESVLYGTAYSRIALHAISCKGEIVSSSNRKPLKIEVFGDSVTCGYGMSARPFETEFSTRTEEGLQTYAYLTARALDADLQIMAASGWGINVGLGPNTSVPTWFNYADINCTALWDHTKFRPDIIIINLGANDAAYIRGDAAGPVSKTESDRRLNEYIMRYGVFLETLQDVYGEGLKILCCYGVMSETEIYAPIDEMVERLNTQGLINIHSLKLSEGVGNGKALHGHPTYQTNIESVEILVNYIRTFRCRYNVCV